MRKAEAAGNLSKVSPEAVGPFLDRLGGEAASGDRQRL